MQKTKQTFEMCLLKQIKKQVHVSAFEGKKIPEE